MYLSRQGIAPAIEPARLAELALPMPGEFFRQVGLDDLKLGEDAVKRWLGEARKSELASVRRAAYRVGAELFGREFARPALEDSAGSVRDWAADYLSDKKTKRRR